MKKILIVNLLILFSIIFISCSEKISDNLLVLENYTGTLGVETDAKHENEIETEEKYILESAVKNKSVEVFGNKYELEYLYSLKSIKISFPIDVYQITSKTEKLYPSDETIPVINFESGTDRIISVSGFVIRQADDKFYTEDELKELANQYLSQICDISSTDEFKIYNFTDYISDNSDDLNKHQFLYYYSYYDKYNGYMVSNDSFVEITNKGKITSVTTFRKNEKNKLEEVKNFKLDENVYTAAIENKLNTIYGKDKYKYKIEKTIVGITSDGKPFIYYQVNVRYGFDGEICIFYVFNN